MARSLKSAPFQPGREQTTQRQSGTFEVTTIDTNASTLPNKMLSYVKIHVQLCGIFPLSYVKVKNV